MLVPGIGEVYRITNPGESIGENVLRDFAGCTTCPNQPKPTRNYDGVEFRLRKRLQQQLALTTTYLYSRLYGNYSGLTSSDENNRNSPSVNRFFDGQYNSFDRQRPAGVRPAADRSPARLQDAKAPTTCRGARASASTGSAESGTPQQTQMSEKGIPFYPVRPRRPRPHADADATDLLLQHELRLSSGHRVTIGLNIQNLFDQDIVTRNFTTRYRDTFNVTDQAFFSGTFDPLSIAGATPATYRPDPRYLLPDQWQNRRQLRLNASWIFLAPVDPAVSTFAGSRGRGDSGRSMPA